MVYDRERAHRALPNPPRSWARGLSCGGSRHGYITVHRKVAPRAPDARTVVRRQMRIHLGDDGVDALGQRRRLDRYHKLLLEGLTKAAIERQRCLRHGKRIRMASRCLSPDDTNVGHGHDMKCHLLAGRVRLVGNEVKDRLQRSGTNH